MWSSRLSMVLLALVLTVQSASAFIVRSPDGRLWLTDRQPFDPNTKVVHRIQRANEPAQNQNHLRLFQVGPQARNDTLRGWVASSGMTCQDATSSYFQGLDPQQKAYWNVSCIHGFAYAIQIPRDANRSPTVMSCDNIQPPGPPCFTQLKRR